MNKTTIIYFDTEFTSLSLNKICGLISLGCVSQDGREFYAELTDTWDESLCSLFVIETVLPLLEGGEYQMTVEQFASRFKEWIEGLADKEVIARSDAPNLDWKFIEEIFNVHGWPKNLRRKCGSISFVDHRQHHLYLAGLQNFWKDNIAKQHHALVDARSLRFAWKYAIRRGL